MNEERQRGLREMNFEETGQPEGAAASSLSINDIESIKLSVTADLGHSEMTVRDVLELKRGSVVTLNCLAGEMTDVYVNGMLLARAEVVVIGDSLHIRIGEISGAGKKTEQIDEEQ